MTPVLLAAFLALAVPEPQGYWVGPNKGETPDTLAGATVVHTEALARMVERGGTVLIDVSPPPPPPPDLPKGTLWMPPPHRDIPGSVWLPGAGRGDLPAPLDAFYRRRLRALTGGDPGRPLVVYCHPRCWLSWNAAKRAVSYGYRHVYWYPDGIEGWREAGHQTTAAKPDSPPP